MCCRFNLIKMTSLLKTWLVKYKCACSAWFPLCQMHFCRKCSRLKCPICIIEEIDIIFCPNCLENNTSADSLQKRFRCPTCHECPMCANILGVRSQADLYYLQCSACHWTSRDLGIPDRRTTTEQWPEPVNPLEEELNKVMNIMKGLSNYERLERERKAQTTKRLSNLGILQNDRFALQSAYNLRKKALNQRPESTETFQLLAPSSDVPGLDPSYFTDPPDPSKTKGLSQIISHPLMGQQGQIHPAKAKMTLRRALRCSNCDTMLYKGELSPNIVKPRLQSFALDFFPEIRISRQVQLVPGQNSPLFLSITNNTMYTMGLKLIGNKVDDKNCVDTSNFSMELTIPYKESASEMGIEDVQDHHGYTSDPNKIASRVLYISRNKAGICIECFPEHEMDLSAGYALLDFTFTSQSENPDLIHTGKLRIALENMTDETNQNT